jgi:biotin synthesis protein BioG
MNERRGGDLLLFFSGWGMDPRPFRFLGTGESDVLLLFDYRKGGESPDFGSLFSSYDRVMLVAWSLGVAVANRVVREWAGRLADAVAINGTTRPVDEQFGIPADVFDGTIENL